MDTKFKDLIEKIKRQQLLHRTPKGVDLNKDAADLADSIDITELEDDTFRSCPNCGFIFSKDFSREKKSTSLEQFDIQPIGSKPKF